ncbi:hypothetical protein ACIBSV_26890 [Embleya sp. NPDC050154]|uniref:hypothetical protein n=1 Tax=Embleya sp. NPDC050154 TaxID=3363988 RepID=UPI0037B22793
MTTGIVPDGPVIVVEISADHAVRVAGQTVPVPPGGDPRAIALSVVAEQARLLGHPVRVHAVEPDGTMFPLNVYADRSIAEAGPPVLPTPRVEPARPERRRGRFGLRRSSSEEVAGSVPARPPVTPEFTAAPAVGSAASPVIGADPVLPAPTWAPPGSAPAVSAPSAPRVRTPDDLPPPEEEERLVLDLIRGAMHAGNGAHALAIAADLDAISTADPARRLAAREVHGYVALATGRPELAVRLYAEAVTFGDGLAEPGEWPARMAANAHFCWLRVTDPVVAQAVGPLVLDAYAAGGAADSAGARAARRRMART